eukprot:963368-Rhodomonas_salina.1
MCNVQCGAMLTQARRTAVMTLCRCSAEKGYAQAMPRVMPCASLRYAVVRPGDHGSESPAVAGPPLSRALLA